MRKQHQGLCLFWTFFKIGLFTFGGGYAMLPLIESICVERRGWITHEEMLRITVLAESTPGPVAINCATYVGNRRGGFLGALAATFGVVLPSFGIILGISLLFRSFLEIPMVVNAFRGIKIAVSLLILQAGLKMLGRLEKKALPLTLFFGAAVAMLLINLFSWRFSTIWLLLIAAVISFAACLLSQKQTAGKEEDG
ncbi:MAG: chromate transporter [Oscillospiraceae bacterium]|nr:chromate transporter [Oscillospiraceae bacterium]